MKINLCMLCRLRGEISESFLAFVRFLARSSGRSLNALQRSREIGDQILGIFDANRIANQVVLDADQ